MIRKRLFNMRIINAMLLISMIFSSFSSMIFAEGVPAGGTSMGDTTKPNLTEGAVSRTSYTTGTVKFTSDEQGEYYYVVVVDGEVEPLINTTGIGTPCTTGETIIIDPINLTAGAKDIYIVVKDAAGNKSSALKIDIAAYVEACTVTFNSMGGSNVSDTLGVKAGSIITAPIAPVRAGYTFGGWYKEAVGTNAWNYSIDTVSLDITLYAKWIADSNTTSGSDSSSTQTQIKSDIGVQVFVNGKAENVGTATTTIRGAQNVTTLSVDPKKLAQKLESEGNNATVTIAVKSNSDIVVGELTGDMAKAMENKQAVLEIKTDTASYKIPAVQIKIDDISTQLGTSVGLKDIKVQIEISKLTADTIRVVEDLAKKGNFTIVVPPLEFAVTCIYDNKKVSITTFNAYVERTIAIPDGVDPSKITTGVVIEPDGTVRHVPTRVILIDGKYYAVINSLTNSTYAIIGHPLEFKDADSHWAKEAINDMGSRMVMGGVENDMFEPDRDITRAELADVIVRALGLKPGMGKNGFDDVSDSDWYSNSIKTAAQYNIISGYVDGKFGPMDKITREEAMTIITRTMNITALKSELTAGEADKLLAGFEDARECAPYAKNSIAICVKTDIISGKSSTIIAPKDSITRAEIAVIVRRLLQKSKLI